MASMQHECDLARVGKGKYTRGISKKRVVNKSSWGKVISKEAKNRGMAHVSMKTKQIMAPREVSINFIISFYYLFHYST